VINEEVDEAADGGPQAIEGAQGTALRTNGSRSGEGIWTD
jgi:hypothetical protein